MHYQCLRECWLDRLYARGERVGPEVAARWPEHFAPCEPHADDSDPESSMPKDTGREAPPALADGTPLAGLRRWQLRRLARTRHPGRDIPWGRTKDMIAALLRLEHGRARTGRAPQTEEESR